MLDCSPDLSSNVHETFLAEFFSRVELLPIKSTDGNNCIAVDMRSCSVDFSLAAKAYLESNLENYRLLVTGEVFYVEVMSPKAMKGMF